MRKIISAALAGLLLAAPAAAGPKLTPEQQLARELEGRVAGEPRKCVSLTNIRSTRIINDTAIVFDAGSTIYVNRPRGGADSLDQWDTIVTKPFGNQLCSIDTVQLYDNDLRFLSGIVFLGDFVPYRRVRNR